MQPPVNGDQPPGRTGEPVHSRRRSTALVVIALLALLVPVAVIGAVVMAGSTIELQILEVSDWHGQVDAAGDVGGAPVLKAYFDAARAEHANTLTLTAGDDVGATPPVSSYFKDVPAILAERMMGIQAGTLGNHNFDSGLGRLQDQIDLAGSTDPTVAGAPFRYVVANLANRDANLSGLADYTIFTYEGVDVAVIGVITESTASVTAPGSMGTMTTSDSVEAAKRAMAAAKADGADVFIALVHEGITSFRDGQPQGELVDFANAVSGFAVIYGDHTDVAWSGTINGQLTVENRSKGVTFTRTVLTIRRLGGEIVGRVSTQVSPVVADVTPDAGVAAMLTPYRDSLAPIFGTTIGTSGVAIPRADSCGTDVGRTCESLVGDVITDAIRETRGTEIAVINSGGIRADLTCPTVDSASDFCPAFTAPPYLITRGQVNGVLPFGNISVAATVDGATLKAMLENGVSQMPAIDGRYPQVSGTCFTYDIEAPAGARVTGAVRTAADGSCTGEALDLTAASSYTLATNEYVAAGGDSYPAITGGVTYGFLDQDVADWLSAAGSVSPALQGRIACTDANPGSGDDCPALVP
ncbi:MAG: 5'-nucleotidase C-terminal domain-containing protein [Chloroflexota bacterium]